MKQKIALINSRNTEIVNSLIKHFSAKNIEFTLLENDSIDDKYNLVILTGFNNKCQHIQCDTIINIYPTLLPAFQNEENPLLKSFTYGIKAGGITIHKVQENKFFGTILAQYPVLIGFDTQFEEYENEILKTSALIYPKVIASILNDKVFDFNDIFTNSECGNCSGNCKTCKK